MLTLKEAAPEFLAKKRVAVTGVSRKPENHGGNLVYQRLRQRGYEVFPVNPNADQVEGDRCFHDLKSIPGGIDAVVIATRPETAEATMCARTSESSTSGCIVPSAAAAFPRRLPVGGENTAFG